jgi:hypothetical protein
MRAANYDRHFEAALRELLARGHAVHVALDVRKRGEAGSTELFDRLRCEGRELTYGLAPGRRRVTWLHFGTKVRLAIDFLRYLGPALADVEAPALRARERAPRLVRAAVSLPGLRHPRAVRPLDRALRAIERVLPIDPGVVKLLEEVRSDAVLVTPLVGLGSRQGDYIREARRRGIPSALLVASWDNLTNKGIVRDRPDLTVVWNDDQVRECVELHGLDRDSVEAVGAHTYDHWFRWEPSTTRGEFCTRLGFRPDRPIVLYVCSSRFIAPREAEFVARWIRALRESPDERLREANVLVRPHPANAEIWDGEDLGGLGPATVWPRDAAAPRSDAHKSDYFDSIFHAAAVVGLNTSALIETAIVGRPVLTLTTQEFRGTQTGTRHFHYLADGGPLLVARSFEEHATQLTQCLEDGGAAARRCAAFVDRFVRPYGRDVAAAPMLADAVERLAAVELAPLRPPRFYGVARALLAPVVAALVYPALTLRAIRGVGRAKPTVAAAASKASRILFCFDHPGSLLHFDRTIAALVERGYRVHVAFARVAPYEHALEVLRPLRSVVVHEHSPVRSDRYTFAAKAARSLIDFAHYLDPDLADARYSRAKWRELTPLPRGFSLLKRPDTLPRWAMRPVLGGLKAMERAIPSDAEIERFLAGINPDVVIVSPLVDRSAYQTDYLKSARALGIPTVLCVSSWDNLTSKGLIRIVPNRVMVWNETQRREAVGLHHVDPDRVVTTGAQQFDHWFGRGPTTAREAFLARFGLPPDRPLVLFAASTRQGAAAALEPAFVARWLDELRRSGDEGTRNASVLIRPHPTDLERWDEPGIDLRGAVIWHRDLPLPIGDDARAQYFDALHHCDALVAINSSAMIEAAIVDRPVHTICLPALRPLQHDLLHFHYLLVANGGFLRAASSFEEHVSLLARDLRDPAAGRTDRARFVARFIRPHGLERPANDVLVDELERAVGISVDLPGPLPLALVPMRALALLLGFVGTASGKAWSHPRELTAEPVQADAVRF